MTDLNVKHKTTKLLKEDIRGNLDNRGFGDIFLDHQRHNPQKKEFKKELLRSSHSGTMALESDCSGLGCSGGTGSAQCVKRSIVATAAARTQSLACCRYSHNFFFFFLGLHPQHMKVPRLEVKSELQLLIHTTANSNGRSKPCLQTAPELRATPDP